MKTIVSIRFILCLFMIFFLSISCQKKKETSPKTQTAKKMVSDFLGQEFPLDKDYKRIISLAPNVTELIYALDAEDKLIGVTSYCNYPPEAQTKPVMGGFSDTDLNLEAILVAKPDLVIATPTRMTSMVEKFDALDIPFYAFSPKTIPELISGIQRVGNLIGHKAQADSIATNFKTTIKQLQQDRSQFKPVRVYLEISATPVMTATNESMVGQILMLAGGLNICGSLDGEYPTVNAEFIIQQNPELIIIAHDAAIAEIKQRSGWQHLSAIETNRIYTDLNHDLIFRPGPRLLDGINEFFQCLYPNQEMPSLTTE